MPLCDRFPHLLEVRYKDESEVQFVLSTGGSSTYVVRIPSFAFGKFRYFSNVLLHEYL